MNIKYFKLFISLALFLFLAPSLVYAADLEISAPDFQEALEITPNAEMTNLPWEWINISPAYDYFFANPEKYDPKKPLTIKINYTKQNNYYKQIFIYDSKTGVWQPILTKDFSEKKYVSATTTAVAGKVIILSNPNILVSGTASWYKFKNGDFAASPDFAKGSILRVTNLANGKFVDVTINDFGPERVKHPDRVVDLDKVAFGKIASTKAGLIKVKVEPLKVIKPLINKSQLQINSTPNISASSAVILRESDGSIIWGKSEKKVSSLASLTKLVAIRTFLDLRPTLNKVVTYKVQDEKLNYLYCKPGESAKLTVKDGETLTIEDLLYSALVGSANNAVETLVRVSGLTRDEFIKKMNSNVKDWGATSTLFVEPTGLSPKNVSSPYDYAIISREVYNSPLIKKISTVLSYTFKTVNTKKAHTIKNTNKLIRESKYPIIGSKTGFINEAGHCLMTRVSSPQGNLIVINFGSSSSANSFYDNEQLIRYGLLKIKK